MTRPCWSRTFWSRTAPQLVHRQEPSPWFPANTPGKPRAALPTLVSFPKSHGFKNAGPGMIFDHNAQEWQEPLPVERERAMGFQPHATKHPALLHAQRNGLLGNFDVADDSFNGFSYVSFGTTVISTCTHAVHA